MKVALVHDWLNGMRGGERCLEAFLAMYPDADIVTLLHVPGSTSARIDSRVTQVSWLNQLPRVQCYYRYLLPLFPLAIRDLDLRGYDLVVSLSHAAAKNIRVPKGVPHVSYCFTPMRYIWDQSREYFGNATPFLWPVIQGLRRWDRRGGAAPEALVAISRFIAARIRCFYGRRAEVIFPPVDTSWITPAAPGTPGEAFLYAGALVPYKRVELIIEAFNRLPDQKLWIVGSGPLEERLKLMAKSNTEFFGRVPDAELARYYARSRAILFPATEDFGMIPIEGMAAGRPVLGMDDGALRETILGVRYWNDSDQISGLAAREATGVFIRKTNTGAGLDEFLATIRYFIEHEGDFLPENAVRQAQRFSPERFQSSWHSLIERLGLPDVRAHESGTGDHSLKSYA